MKKYLKKIFLIVSGIIILPTFLFAGGSGTINTLGTRPSIGGAIVGGTANSVLFVNPDGVISEDNDNFNYVDATNTFTLGGILKLKETGGGTDTASIQSPASLSSSYALTLPPDDGLSGQSLTTNGTGTLGWTSVATLAGGDTGDVQFNLGDAFQGNSIFHWDNAYESLGIGTGFPTLGTKIETVQEITPGSAGDMNVAEDATAGNFLPGDVVQYHGYGYRTINGVKTYSATYQSTFVLNVVGSGVSVQPSWATGSNVDGYFLCRDYNGSGFTQGFDVGNVTAYLDTENGDFYNIDCTLSPSGTFTGNTKINYDNGTGSMYAVDSNLAARFGSSVDVGTNLTFNGGNANGELQIGPSGSQCYGMFYGQSGSWGTNNSSQFVLCDGAGANGSAPALNVYDYSNGGSFQVGGALSYGGYNGGTVRSDVTGVGLWDANSLALSDQSRIKMLVQGGNVTISQTNGGTGGLIVPSLQVDSIVNDTGLASGTYTPTLTNTTNVSASTPRLATYMRVGNTVTVGGQLDIDPTATGATLLGISLPIASNFSTAFQLGGTSSATTVAIESAGIESDATNDRASLKYTAVDTTNHTVTYSFTYQVI